MFLFFIPFLYITRLYEFCCKDTKKNADKIVFCEKIKEKRIKSLFLYRKGLNIGWNREKQKALATSGDATKAQFIL